MSHIKLSVISAGFKLPQNYTTHPYPHPYNPDGPKPLFLRNLSDSEHHSKLR